MGLHPDLVRNADEVLACGGYPSAHVISVDYDSILFVSQYGRVYTAWLDRSSVRLVQDGFVAQPPNGLHPAPGRPEPTPYMTV